MRRKYLTMGLFLASLVPVWRSGSKENLTFWEFLWNHTIYGDPIEYLPKENYEELILSEEQA